MIKSIAKVDFPLHSICKNCIVSHCKNKLYSFDILCNHIPEAEFTLDKKIREELSTTGAFWAMAISDISFFAEHVCGFIPRAAQKEVLLCSAKKIVLRLPRQSGKTIAICIKALFHALTNPRTRVLIVTPFETQVLNILSKMNDIISDSPVKEFVYMSKKGKYYTSQPFNINFKNGSQISAYNVNQSGGTNIRGQSGHFLILDELDYIAKEAVEAVLPIMNANPDIKLLAASTPSGIKSFFWNWCHADDFKEVHYKYPEMEHYSVALDEEWKKSTEADVYKREILAEFTVQEAGVFNNLYIDKAVDDYYFDDLVRFPERVQRGIYTIGVDWNESLAGVHIIVTKFDAESNKYIIQNLEIIPPSTFTQIKAVNRILELNEIYQPKHIVVDVGFGITQIQMLKKYGVENPETHIEDRLVPLEYSSYVEITDPITGKPSKQKLKPLLVSVTTRYLENNRLILPKNQDYPSKLVGQMRDYKIVGMSASNIPIYSKGYVHTLEAMMNSLWGMYLYSPESFVHTGHTQHFAPITQKNTNTTTGLIKFPKTKTAGFSRGSLLLPRSNRNSFERGRF